MRVLARLALTVFCTQVLSADKAHVPITLATQSTWYEYASRLKNSPTIRVQLCRFTVRNKSHTPMFAKELHLRWHHGKGIKVAPQSLRAGLYHHKRHASRIPVDEQFVAHGHWNVEERLLMFRFHTPLKITSSHDFYVVVECDEAERALLKDSTFYYDDRNPIIAYHSKKHSPGRRRRLERPTTAECLMDGGPVHVR